MNQHGCFRHLKPNLLQNIAEDNYIFAHGIILGRHFRFTKLENMKPTSYLYSGKLKKSTLMSHGLLLSISKIFVK